MHLAQNHDCSIGTTNAIISLGSCVYFYGETAVHVYLLNISGYRWVHLHSPEQMQERLRFASLLVHVELSQGGRFTVQRRAEVPKQRLMVTSWESSVWQRLLNYIEITVYHFSLAKNRQKKRCTVTCYTIQILLF